jgi:catechol 2,3-dioxygenase-like lactoylglutathione lyase family enzyme
MTCRNVKTETLGKLGIASRNFLALVAFFSLPLAAVAATPNHITIALSNTSEAVNWYEEHMDCQPIAGRDNAVSCGTTEIEFLLGATVGGSQGTGVDHIGFSVTDLDAKMNELENVGVRGSGVRLLRFDDGSLVRDIPGLFKIAFIFDPWGTKIELVQDADLLGFHHIHLNSVDPVASLDWYSQVFGGEAGSLKNMLDGVQFGDIWLLATEYTDGRPGITQGRAIDHIGFEVADLDEAAVQMNRLAVEFQQEPIVPDNARSTAKQAFIRGPDGVLIAIVEPGWAGVEEEVFIADASESTELYVPPQTPWGEPDLQGIWTADAAHGIPLQRGIDVAGTDELTPEEAAARRERGTLNSIWGYDREWRDTTLGYVKSAPSTQVAMVIDPPNGQLPETTAAYKEVVANRAPRIPPQRARTPVDLGTYVRCITRGPVGMMMPSIYNNGLQIIQSPGNVAIQKEMIHETRIISTEPREGFGEELKTWLGDSHGRWEGNTLVVEVRNLNGRTSYLGSSEEMKLTQRFTRTGPNTMEYQFIVDDPAVWTEPWTGMFTFVKDDSQYELVEYACHEGNYGMTNTLSAARAIDAREAEAAAND